MKRFWEPGIWECGTGQIRIDKDHTVTWLTGINTGIKVDKLDWYWKGQGPWKQIFRFTPEDPYAESDF